MAKKKKRKAKKKKKTKKTTPLKSAAFVSLRKQIPVPPYTLSVLRPTAKQTAVVRHAVISKRPLSVPLTRA
jgi:hypothetical protein